MGLVNSGATFQRLMQSTMGDIHLKECLLYLDDIIVFSSTFQNIFHVYLQFSRGFRMPV